MKKIMTLCFFAFAIVMGTQSINAQAVAKVNPEVNAIAASKTAQLKKLLKFNTDTQAVVYEAYQQYEFKMQSVSKVNASGKKVSDADMKAINAKLDSKMRETLTDEQYKRFLEHKDKLTS